MKEEKFNAINFIRQLIIYLDTHLDNFPRKDIELKTRIKNASFDMLELAYQANVSTNKEIKINCIEEIMCKIKILDFLLNLCYDKKIINSKRYIKFGEQMSDILKYLQGWRKSIVQNMK